MRFEVRIYSPSQGVNALQWDAACEADIRARAIREGLEIIELREGNETRALAFGRGDFPTRQFAQEIVALTEAGFGLVEALETLQAKEQNASYREVVQGVLAQLRAGASLSYALAAFPNQFPPLFVESVRASEQTGDISKTLRRYTDYETQLDALKNYVIAASVYPLLLIAVGFLVVIFMLGYVVPRLAGAYENVRGQTPALSRLLFSWGEVVNAHGWLVGSCALVMCLAMLHFVFRGEAKAKIFHWAKRIPVLGEQIRTYHLARLYRTIGMLLNGGTPLVRALEMAAGILPHDLRESLTSARSRIAQGEAFSSAFDAAGLTTIVASRMFRVGERSGDLGGVMERIAAFHDDRLEQWIKRFVKVFEPALMALIGVIIGGIVLLMYMPIFELAGSVG